MLQFNAHLVKPSTGDDDGWQKQSAMKAKPKTAKLSTPIHQITLKKPKKGSTATVSDIRKQRGCNTPHKFGLHAN